jgi:Flp pilus assembly pilin Flp
MSRRFASTGRKLKQKLSRRLPVRYRRDDSGLTTLEWLLIVAAVAGLAALAVVLVQNVVSDTSEQIAGSSARRTAAEFAAAEVVADAIDSAQPRAIRTWVQWQDEYERKCNRLQITYSDIEPALTIVPTFDPPSAGGNLPAAASWPTINTTADVRAAAPGTAPRAHCQVT